MSDKSLEKLRNFNAEENKHKMMQQQKARSDVILMADNELAPEPQPPTNAVYVDDADSYVPTSESLLTLQNAAPINVVPTPTVEDSKSTQTSLSMPQMSNVTYGSRAYTTTTPDGRTVTYHTPGQIGKQYVTYNMDSMPQVKQQTKPDVPVKRPRGRPRKTPAVSNTNSNTAPAAPVPAKYRPSPASSNTSLPDSMQSVCNDGRQLYRAFTNDGQGMQWPLPFSQYPYGDYLSRQAQLYEAQGRPYTGLSYNNDMYGVSQPYSRDDTGEFPKQATIKINFLEIVFVFYKNLILLSCLFGFTCTLY